MEKLKTHPMYYDAPCIGDERYQRMMTMDMERNTGSRYKQMTSEQARLYGVWGGKTAETLYRERGKKKFKRVRALR